MRERKDLVDKTKEKWPTSFWHNEGYKFDYVTVIVFIFTATY